MVFTILYRQHWLRVTIHGTSITVASLGERSAPIKIGLREKLYELQSGGMIELSLKH